MLLAQKQGRSALDPRLLVFPAGHVQTGHQPFPLGTEVDRQRDAPVGGAGWGRGFCHPADRTRRHRGDARRLQVVLEQARAIKGTAFHLEATNLKGHPNKIELIHTHVHV